METIIMYGADWCPDCQRAKAFLEEHDIDFEYKNIELDDASVRRVEEVNHGKKIIPTFEILGKTYTNPDNAELACLLGINAFGQMRFYGADWCPDCRRAKAFLSDHHINYQFIDVDEFDWATREVEAINNGKRIIPTIIVNGTPYSNPDNATLQRVLGLEEQRPSKVYDVVLAVGSTYRRLHIPGEEELVGAGIHFCATCDGPFYRDKEIIVLGGGNSALEEGLYLTEFTNKVSFVTNIPEFTASQTYVEKLDGLSNVATYTNKSSVEFIANDDGLFEALKVRDNDTGEEELITADGVFIFIGLTPNTTFLEGIVELDERGFIVTQDGTVETSLPGVFAAGDSRQGAIAQIASATGEGVLANFGVKEYLKRVW